jgi:hypothetical protein
MARWEEGRYVGVGVKSATNDHRPASALECDRMLLAVDDYWNDSTLRASVTIVSASAVEALHALTLARLPSATVPVDRLQYRSTAHSLTFGR